MTADDCTLELLVDYQNKLTNEYLATVPFLKPNWLARLNENKLGGTKINVPVYQYHADNDQIVRYDQATVLRDKYCALGVTLSFKTFNTGHITTVARGNADALAFLATGLLASQRRRRAHPKPSRNDVKMKSSRILAVAALCAVTGLAACGDKDEAKAPAPSTPIETTTPPPPSPADAPMPPRARSGSPRPATSSRRA